MITEKQKERARLFSRMHQEEKLFILPNAWDVGSACIFERSGFPVVATTSAGVAYSLGYADGEQITLEDILELTQRITKRINLPLSVDFERGFGESAEEVKNNVRRLLYAGAVGLNLEDGLADGTLSSIALQTEKIRDLSALKKELDLDFVINARTCTYLLQVADEAQMLEIAIERGNAYLSAGADCVFIPGALDEKTVSALTNRIQGPLNLLLTATTWDMEKLQALGVRRLSIGSAMARWSYGKVIDLAHLLLEGETAQMRENNFTLATANQYFGEKEDRA